MINLDFKEKKQKESSSTSMTKEEFQEVMSTIVKKIGEDMVFSNQKITEFILQEKYERQRDMSFILSMLGKTRPHVDMMQTYYNFCKGYDKKRKEKKENV